MVRLKCTAYAQYVSAWHTERVLVNRYDMLVKQQSLRYVVDSSEVDGHQQLRCEYRPQTHLYSLLVVTETVVADYQLQTKRIHSTRLQRGAQGRNHVFKVGGSIPWSRVLLPF